MNLNQRLGNASAKAVAHATMTALDAVQQFAPESQIMGAGVMLLSVCERFGIQPGEALAYTHNLLRLHADTEPEFRALKDYCSHEFT